MEGLLRIGVGADRHGETVAKQGEVLLVGTEEHPDGPEIGQGQERLQRLEEGAGRHLAVDHAAGEGSPQRERGAVGRATAPG